VTWTRLLASGTGGLTYVFTVILALFLVGIAIGAMLFNSFRSRISDPIRLLAWTQLAVAGLAIAGLVLVISQPHELDPGRPFQSFAALFGSAILVVLPVTIVLGIAFPTASELLRDERSRAGSASGWLLAANTTGAILGSLVIPFVLMPTIGSPVIVVVLGLANAAMGIALATRARTPSRGTVMAGLAIAAAVAIIAVIPGRIAQPNEALIAAKGWQLFDSKEDEIASVQAGRKAATAELWVGGISMTLLTVDAKLMPILPLIARPESDRALVVAFGMGTAFRSALIAGLETDAVELVPSVPKMFGHYYADADAVLADPRGEVIVADGRNHLELTTERFDIILTDPPPPIQSSGVSVISSLEYYQQGLEHLTPGGVMMQWTPYGTTESDLKEHIRTFASVFAHVTAIRGPGRYGFYMLGSQEPVEIDPGAISSVLDRPGVLADISSAYDSPTTTLDGWTRVIEDHIWMSDDTLRRYAGDGPLITDDEPRPEYFLLRGLADIIRG
jgi:spermidine synthase